MASAVEENVALKGKAFRDFSGFVSTQKPDGTSLESGAVIDKITAFSNTLKCRYFIIYHNRDMHEDLTQKIPHVHFVLKRTEGRHLESGILRQMSDFCGFDKAMITISHCINYIGAIRYLIHEDDLEKYQYSPNEVLTNDKPTAELAFSGQTIVTLDLLLDLAAQSKSKIFFMKRIGLENYQAYRAIIKDILDDYEGKESYEKQ
jgi:hypothetical protein